MILLLLFAGWGCHEAVPVIHISKFKGDKPAAITFTFDDTNQSGIDVIAPLFDERDWRASFFINCTDDYEGWKAMALRGHEIGNHSCSHLDLSGIHDNATLAYEINFNYDQITENIGIPPITFVHPYDKTNSDVDRVAFERHLFTRIIPKGFCKPMPYGYFLQAIIEIDTAIATNDWLVLTGHGMGDGCCEASYDAFVKTLDYVKLNEKKIWVDTFKNVAFYKIERENAVLTQDNDGNATHLSLRVNLDIHLPYAVPWVPLTIVVPLNDNFSKKVRIINAGDQRDIPFAQKEGALRFDILPNEDVVIIFYNGETA